jgi:hypothetical protein
MNPSSGLGADGEEFEIGHHPGVQGDALEREGALTGVREGVTAKDAIDQAPAVGRSLHFHPHALPEDTTPVSYYYRSIMSRIIVDRIPQIQVRAKFSLTTQAYHLAHKARELHGHILASQAGA